MKFKFYSAYKLIGATKPKDGEDIVIAEFNQLHAKAILTYDVNNYLSIIDKGLVVGLLLLKGMFGPKRAGTFEENLKQELEELKEQRNKEFGDGAYIVIEADGEIEDFNFEVIKEMDDFVVSMKGPNKQLIKDKYRSILNGAIAGFSIATEQICGTKKVIDGVYFLSDQEKPIFSFELNMSGRGIVSTGLDLDAIEFVKKNIKKLSKKSDIY